MMRWWALVYELRRLRNNGTMVHPVQPPTDDQGFPIFFKSISRNFMVVYEISQQHSLIEREKLMKFCKFHSQKKKKIETLLMTL